MGSLTKTVKFYTEGWVCECDALVPIDLDCPKCGAKEPENLPDIRIWDDEFSWAFPAKYRLCEDCGGKGTTYLGWAAKDQPAFSNYGGRMISHEVGEPPCELEYDDFKSGIYEKQCPACEGERVETVIDEDNIPEKDKPIWEAYLSDLECQHEMDAMYEAERRFGC